MASSLTMEKLEKILESNDCIKAIGWINKDKYGFSRTYQFEVRNVVYEIEWWCNISYLYCGELFVLFDEMRIDSTWPNHFKNNIQFYYQGKVCCILPIEEYGFK